MECLNQSEAYRFAYDTYKMTANSVHVNASKLFANTKVALRVQELQAAQKRLHAQEMPRRSPHQRESSIRPHPSLHESTSRTRVRRSIQQRHETSMQPLSPLRSADDDTGSSHLTVTGPQNPIRSLNQVSRSL